MLYCCADGTRRLDAESFTSAFVDAGLIVNIGSVCGIRPQRKACACGSPHMACTAALRLIMYHIVKSELELRAGDSALPIRCTDGASKWALAGWSRSSYENLKDHGIKVRGILRAIVPQLSIGCTSTAWLAETHSDTLAHRVVGSAHQSRSG
jgi:NAD(P)-dependent dehydrogenase (short-subunit alcohol dehydrogenase family)